jgi:hypothetical protein
MLAEAEEILGTEFPARTFEKFDGLPGELLMFSTHRYALPQFLSFMLALRAAAAEPSFRTVINGAIAGVDVAAWYHLLLQLEAGRACREMGHPVAYEPAIEGSASKGDLLVDAVASPWLIETTVVLRADADKTWERYEDRVKAMLRGVEHRHDVTCVTVLEDHPDGANGDGALDPVTEDWLLAVEFAAREAHGSRVVQTVAAGYGRVEIYPDGVPDGTTIFTGAVQERDGWKRLRRTLAGKAKQVEGTLPAWVRVDCRDGLFMFGEWPKMPQAERIAVIADAIIGDVRWPVCAQGVVLSSGLASSFSATDPAVEDFTVETDRGILMRRMVAPYLLRETVIIPIVAQGSPVAQQWREAYGAEGHWLDTDLASAGMPPLSQLWTA